MSGEVKEKHSHIQVIVLFQNGELLKVGWAGWGLCSLLGFLLLIFPLNLISVFLVVT